MYYLFLLRTTTTAMITATITMTSKAPPTAKPVINVFWSSWSVTSNLSTNWNIINEQDISTKPFLRWHLIWLWHRFWRESVWYRFFIEGRCFDLSPLSLIFVRAHFNFKLGDFKARGSQLKYLTFDFVSITNFQQSLMLFLIFHSLFKPQTPRFSRAR